MVATKEQERKALEQIRKIVAELGEDSYIATAFSGCFEIAEENIENDFAMSMSDRAEDAERKLAKVEKEKGKLETQIRSLNLEINILQRKVLSDDDLSAIRTLTNKAADQLDLEERDQAKKIVEFAENPASAEFRDAVKAHRQAAKSYTETVELGKRVYSAQFAQFGSN